VKLRQKPPEVLTSSVWRERLPVFQAVALAGLGGFSDATSFLLFGTFTGHITGAMVLAALHLVAGRGFLFLSQLIAIAIFLSGTWAGVLLTQSTIRLALGLETLLFFVAYFLLRLSPELHPGWLSLAAVATTSAAMGIQNGCLQRVASVSIHTSFLTGLITTWITKRVKRSQEEAHRRPLYAAVVGFFFLGAVFGAYCTSRVNREAYLVMAGISAAIFALRK
jgi:uncharacterized membrane protein YoaK (UPF0700 family)